MTMIGRIFTRYQILEEVGHGGMAIVYKGLDTMLNREVAVKVLHPHLAGQPESRARLQREAHAVAKLRHENILEIFDYSGPDSPESYIVTEFIHGSTLKQFLAEGPLPFPELAEMIASEVARALEHAHGLGVIHRDVKPENVMIRDDGLLKLTDFGIAQIVDKERMTVTGQLLGSPAYMAPENIDGRPLDFRTDVFAVGVVTYQLATGELPFRGKNPHEVLKRIAEGKYAPPESVNPLVGTRLSRALKKALARDPNQRFADVALLRAELLEDLKEVGIDEPREELKRYFADRHGYAATFRPRLLETLTARGSKLHHEGRTAAALEMWNRALALEPGSTELRQLVEGVARRRAIRRALPWAALAALALSGAALGARTLRRHQAERRAHALASDEAEPQNTTAPTVRVPLVRPPLEPARSRVPVSRVAHVVAPPSRSRLVELVPSPKAVKVSLDGKELGDFSPALARLELAPGPHTLTFESPVCFTRTILVGAGETPEKIIARLKWKPATLTVRARPPSADVLLDHTIPERAGQPITVPISEVSPDGRRTVVVKVSAPGFASEERTVLLRANDAKEQEFNLKPMASE